MITINSPCNNFINSIKLFIILHTYLDWLYDYISGSLALSGSNFLIGSKFYERNYTFRNSCALLSPDRNY